MSFFSWTMTKLERFAMNDLTQYSCGPRVFLDFLPSKIKAVNY